MPTVTNLSTSHDYEGWLHPIGRRLVAGDYVALFIGYQDGFRFNRKLARDLKGKPVVVIDYVEYGYSCSWNNVHLWGMGMHSPRVVSDEDAKHYHRLDEWLSEQEVPLYFKRELTQFHPKLYRDSAPILPVDMLSCERPVYPKPTKDEWMARLGGVFHLYGYSHIDRKRLHGALQAKWGRTLNSLQAARNSRKKGYPYHLLEQVDWFARYPFSEVMECQNDALISPALPGYGVKCFHNSESCINAVPAVADLGMVWAVPWDDSNAIMLPTHHGELLIEESVAVLEGALADKEGLYQKVLRAMDSSAQLEEGHFTEKFLNQYIRSII